MKNLLSKEMDMALPSKALSPETDAIITGLVVREFEEPGLSEMPQGIGCQCCCVGSIRLSLACKCAVTSGHIRLGDVRIAIPRGYFVVTLCIGGKCAIMGCIIRKADLVRLIDVKHWYIPGQ